MYILQCVKAVKFAENVPLPPLPEEGNCRVSRPCALAWGCLSAFSWQPAAALAFYHREDPGKLCFPICLQLNTGSHSWSWLGMPILAIEEKVFHFNWQFNAWDLFHFVRKCCDSFLKTSPQKPFLRCLDYSWKAPISVNISYDDYIPIMINCMNISYDILW